MTLNIGPLSSVSSCHWCGDELGQLPLTPAAITIGDKEFCSENCLLKWMDAVDEKEQLPARKQARFPWKALVVQLLCFGGMRACSYFSNPRPYLWWHGIVDIAAIALMIWIDIRYAEKLL